MSVTIRDVAREAGTTIGTVSKAMNNSYTISGEMTAHVKEVAERLGYRPNARAQIFARQVNREIVFLTYLPRDIAFTNPHMFEILAGAEQALVSKGYALKLRGCDYGTVCALAKEIIDGKHADGLLIHASVVTRDLAVFLTHNKVPHIAIGKPVFTNSMCWIDNNNQLSGELAAGHLLDLGHRSIAFIGGLAEDTISQDRLAGAKTRLKDRKIELKYVQKGESSVGSGESMAMEIIDSGELPDAFICANNLIAYGCLRTLQKKKIEVPGRVSIITFDDYPLAQIISPTLTTISIDMFEMGMSAGKLMVNKIRNPELQVQTFTTIPRLITRESTAESVAWGGSPV